MGYNGPRMKPDDPIGFCRCGFNKGAHRAMEAYHGEERLEGRKSSSTAKANSGCTKYRESGLTLREALKLRSCSRRWFETQKRLEA